jgi:hypothetical protein
MDTWSFAEKYHEHMYHHAVYVPGTWVYVSTRIRERHELSPVAGCTLQACEGTYVSSDDPELQAFIAWEEQKRPHETLVPVACDGKVWLVEQEYVSLAERT